MGIGSRVANAIESYWSYLADAVWPAGLAALYPHPYLIAPPSRAKALAAGALGVALIAATALVLLASRKRPYLGVGWLWYLGTLVPVLGLVQLGLQSRADRYMYLPLQGLAIMLAWGVADLVPASGAGSSPGSAVAALVALAVVTRLQLRHWENSLALFTRAVSVTERQLLRPRATGLRAAGGRSRRRGPGPLPRSHRDRALVHAAVLQPGPRAGARGRSRRGDRGLPPGRPLPARPGRGAWRAGSAPAGRGQPGRRQGSVERGDPRDAGFDPYREALDEVERRLASAAAGTSQP